MDVCRDSIFINGYWTQGPGGRPRILGGGKSALDWLDYMIRCCGAKGKKGLLTAVKKLVQAP